MSNEPQKLEGKTVTAKWKQDLYAWLDGFTDVSQTDRFKMEMAANWAYDRLKEDNERLYQLMITGEQRGVDKSREEIAALQSRIQQLEQSNVPRWVKAETRLPSDDSIGEIICRVPEIHNGKETGRTFVETRPWFKMSDVSEWLEELPDKRQSPDK